MQDTHNDNETRRRIVHTIGEVTVTIDLPAGCPDPDIDLHVHVDGAVPSQRRAAIRAFGLDNGDARWWQRGDTAGVSHDDRPLRATVFLTDAEYRGHSEVCA